MNLNTRTNTSAIALVIIFGTVFLASVIAALFYFPAERFLFKPDAVTEEILASDLSERMPDLVAGWIIDGNLQLPDGSSNYLSALNRGELAGIIEQLLPADWTAIQSAVIARQVQEYLLGKTDSLNVTLDLTDVRTRLTGDSLATVAERIVGSSNACSALDLANLALTVAGSSTAAIPLCQPPDTFRPLVVRSVENELLQLGAQLPASLPFQVGPSAAISPGVLVVRVMVRLLPWTPWLAVGSALLILLVMGGSMRKGFLAIGLPLSPAGIIAAGIGFVLAAVRESTLAPWLDSIFSRQLPNGLATILTPALVNVFSRFCLSVVAWGCAAVLLGAALVIVSRLLKR
ncbi:MAG TPA: hypothetical protein VN452_02375 [Longilinea sp.]|nr:hypothetical protein [Longilinea sp.]